MDEQMIGTRNGKRIDFSPDEINYMREQATASEEDRLSYASIARELNIRFKDHNEGRRTRQSVYDFMTADPDAPVIERVPIPRDLLQQFRATGKKLEAIVIPAIKEALKCKPSTKPAKGEGAANAAESSPSQQNLSTGSGTGSSSSQTKRSGKTDSRH